MHPTMDSTTSEEKAPDTESSTGPSAGPNPPTESGPDTDDIIAKYEEMFAFRFTPEDPVYLPYIDKGMDPPPVVENYHVRRQRQNWNDNRDQRYSQDRGYKRGYNESGWRDDGPQRQRGNRDYHHQGRGWGHEQQWGHQPRQDWGGRGGPGQGSRPPHEQWERRSDDRQQGRSSGSHAQSGQGSRGRNSSRPGQDEWT